MESFVENLILRLGQIFEPAVLGALAARLATDALVALLTFSVFYVIWRALSRLIRIVNTRAKLDPTASRFIQMAAKTAILSIGFITALSSIGVNTTSVIASLGIAGLTIGFAAQDALANIISGLFIFWDRPFVIGDLIEADGLYGRVDDITLRSTRVVTPQGKMLAIPNTTMVNSTVASYTNFPHLRIDLDITIGPNEDIARTRSLLLEMVSSDADFMNDPAPEVVVLSLNDYNNLIGFRAWIYDERKHREIQDRTLERINDIFQREGVVMPLETIQLAPFSINQIPPDGASANTENQAA